MHLTVHRDPGTAVAAVYDKLMHVRAHTHGLRHIQTHSSAEGSRWSLSHKTPFCQSSLTMMELFLVQLG